ncbi:hypothetical protein GLAREA_02543 [Glarea lozoyensis ATCC 20868]|uniref:Uncharacterized protein n=1 Tax=Glarea lozoyensis (strain ATCC 20868 / MF5171) TaxID=1116229 RepID=S3CLL4_GLAL2|nr:uncharacterized protein GLAREA_02543 [Glarea lozoyensis ATCC 20868]EPE26630.1 hypothetical protein GLAREA_02543 [Glarea lozoyensis ATCC 20868]
MEKIGDERVTKGQNSSSSSPREMPYGGSVSNMVEAVDKCRVVGRGHGNTKQESRMTFYLSATRCTTVSPAKTSVANGMAAHAISYAEAGRSAAGNDTGLASTALFLSRLHAERCLLFSTAYRCRLNLKLGCSLKIGFISR